jgi:hypothetical protein
LSKGLFFVTILVLWLMGMTATSAMAFASIDGALGLAFLYAWWRLAA